MLLIRHRPRRIAVERTSRLGSLRRANDRLGPSRVAYRFQTAQHPLGYRRGRDSRYRSSSSSSSSSNTSRRVVRLAGRRTGRDAHLGRDRNSPRSERSSGGAEGPDPFVIVRGGSEGDCSKWQAMGLNAEKKKKGTLALRANAAHGGGVEKSVRVCIKGYHLCVPACIRRACSQKAATFQSIFCKGSRMHCLNERSKGSSFS